MPRLPEGIFGGICSRKGDGLLVRLKMHAFFCDLQVDRLIRLQHAEALVRLMNYLFELRAQRSMTRHSRAHLKPAQRLG